MTRYSNRCRKLYSTVFYDTTIFLGLIGAGSNCLRANTSNYDDLSWLNYSLQWREVNLTAAGTTDICAGASALPASCNGCTHRLDMFGDSEHGSLYYVTISTE